MIGFPDALKQYRQKAFSTEGESFTTKEKGMQASF
jgi:hypothetical protein